MEDAGFWRRTLALVIDGVILILMRSGLYVGASIKFTRLDIHSNVNFGIDDLYGVIFVATYFVILWTILGASIGQMLVGVRVSTLDDEKPSFSRALLRYLVLMISFLPFGLPLLWVAIDRDKRGIHDHLSGTQVLTRW